MEVNIEDISQRLKVYSNFVFPDIRFKKSAVLILLLVRDDTFHLILTSRTRSLNHHSGEMSFPGGRFDPELDSNLKSTALREVAEEIGIKSSQIQILGRLNDTPTLTGYNISSYVGLISNPQLVSYQQNFQEVADIVEVPLEFFTQPDVIKERSVPMEFGKEFQLLSCKYKPVGFQKSFHIWGATAHIIADFFDVCLKFKITSSQYIRPALKDLLEYKQLVEQQKKKKSQKG